MYRGERARADAVLERWRILEAGGAAVAGGGHKTQNEQGTGTNKARNHVIS
jgi:hypothetical protein